ncbi:MAG: antibiotic biosynthesis monooxygenase [Hyphomonas sp. BRH_c22]|uniref:antibiotic biosynthesis monooxygenase n=1 Tax=Hyphomonas sp. BRH_c22 TaxID=1629710 RepID=UPI0005F14590|nr:antibiotic biosynthesis monooxygenase [Hyphomonas sp. BRH_c22]KJS34783.1 MAG: antibiotic biosynthesis monooxygenase [Hyphomonas sp. BRH_c22]
MVEDSAEPVTVVVSRRVAPGEESRFETLSSKLTLEAANFEGHLGATMLRPEGKYDPEYRIIFKFDTQGHLSNWLKSEVRKKWLAEIEPLLKAPSHITTMSGLVAWFSVPGQNPVQPPPKYKMAIVGWVALFPIVTLVFWAFGPQLSWLPLVPRVLLVTAVVMALMTYVAMPRVTKFFSFWLYPHKDRSTKR